MNKFNYTIPTSDPEFDKFQSAVLYRLIGRTRNWQIPDEEVEKLVALQKSWKEYRIKTFGKHHCTHNDVKRKNEIKKEFVKLLRDFIKTWIAGNLKMTDIDRMTAGFKLIPKPRTFIPPPYQIPELTIKYIENFQVRVRVKPPYARPRAGVKKTGKPKDVEFIHIVYDIGEHQGGPSECRFRLMLSKMYTDIFFDAADEGKKVAMYARYMNEKHEPGNWSSMKIFWIR
ncbi:MAG: hypothetical protein IPP77_14780 [Bacteroidetes bacterium]|nr:hypothetical protein [Bacteroidota bacterium]